MFALLYCKDTDILVTSLSDRKASDVTERVGRGRGYGDKGGAGDG